MSDTTVDDAFAPLGDSSGHSKNAGTAEPVPITPVPADAPAAHFKHSRLGTPSTSWAYRDEQNRLLGYAVRFETPDGKQVLPRTWCRRPDASLGWTWKSFSPPRPLFGLDRLAANPFASVLVVEGEKTASAAQCLFTDHVVVTWPGGGKAVNLVDWSPLNGRRLVLWPDADPEGIAAMAAVRRNVNASDVRTVVLPEDLTNGWDLADDIPEGIDVQKLILDALSSSAEPIVPVGYILNSQGLFWREEDDASDMMLAGPLTVLAETRDGDGTSWGLLLSWNDNDGRPHRHALPRSVLAGDGSDARKVLLDGGLQLSPARKAREKLNNFLLSVRSPARARATARVGWHDGVFVLPDEAIGKSAGDEQLLLQQAGTIKHSFRQRGTLPEWRDRIARLAEGNSRLILAISAGFAAALLDPCNAESGGIHFRGPSSTGKSTTLLMAGSVWGGGEPGGYVRSWRATANGLEGVALAHCDTLLALDEISQVQSREASEVAYMLGNGSGKSRSNREGLAKQPAQWRVLFLSSGELSLAEKMAEDGRGRRAAAGQSVRLIDLPADAGAGLGLFENLHGFASADVFARHIKVESMSFYGTAARAFVQHVASDRVKLSEAVSSYTQEFVRKFVPQEADGQVQRVAQRFGLVAMAGEIAIQTGLVPWAKGTAIEASARCFNDWIITRGGVEPAEVQMGIEQVRAFVSAHGSSRFLAAWEEAQDHNIRDVVGYRRRVGEDWEYYVTNPAWRDTVCRGFNGATIAVALKERGFLIAPEQGRYTTLLRVPGCGRQRLFHLSPKLLEGSHD